MADRRTTRGQGDRSESRMLTIFRKSFSAEETKNSGASRKDGDIKAYVGLSDQHYVRAEAKYRNSEGWTISKKHWEEICQKCFKHGGIPALITENKNNQSFITMDLNHFVELLASWKHKCDKNEED